MKYNMSNIMKRAWEIKKENSENIFSLCLKMAWSEAKAPKIERIVEGSPESREMLDNSNVSFIFFSGNFVTWKMNFVTGTEKQVSFACVIAGKLVSKCANYIECCVLNGKLAKELATPELIKFITQLEAFSNAGEFINKFKTKVCQY